MRRGEMEGARNALAEDMVHAVAPEGPGQPHGNDGLVDALALSLSGHSILVLYVVCYNK
jgi:hypothetical protein